MQNNTHYKNHGKNVTGEPAYENDVLEIPEEYKKMSLDEIKIEKKKMIKEIKRRRKMHPLKS